MKGPQFLKKSSFWLVQVILLVRCSVPPVDDKMVTDITTFVQCESTTISWKVNTTTPSGAPNQLEVALSNPPRIYLENKEEAQKMAEKAVAKIFESASLDADDWYVVVIFNPHTDRVIVELDEKQVAELVTKYSAATL
jgi:hypothetical protein